MLSLVTCNNGYLHSAIYYWQTYTVIGTLHIDWQDHYQVCYTERQINEIKGQTLKGIGSNYISIFNHFNTICQHSHSTSCEIWLLTQCVCCLGSGLDASSGSGLDASSRSAENGPLPGPLTGPQTGPLTALVSVLDVCGYYVMLLCMLSDMIR